jgi:hypothetical protein
MRFREHDKFRESRVCVGELSSLNYTVCPGSVRTYFFKIFPAMQSVGELWR